MFVILDSILSFLDAHHLLVEQRKTPTNRFFYLFSERFIHDVAEKIAFEDSWQKNIEYLPGENG